jgi:predicted amidohydrolase
MLRSPTVQKLTDISRESHPLTATGLLGESSATVYKPFVISGPWCIGLAHRKIHLWINKRPDGVSCDPLPVRAAGTAKAGMLVCYAAEFPKAACIPKRR